MRTLGFISLVAASGHHRTRPKEVRGPKPPYSLDNELYHMSQRWDLSRITAPTIIDVQIIEQLFQFLPYYVIVPSIVGGNT